MVLVIAGTPGTGKTSVGVRLARLLGRIFTTLSWLVLEHAAWSNYDVERRSFVVDEERVCELVERLSGHVVETHWLEPFLRCASLEGVVLTRSHPLVLYRRLVRRAWPRRKVVENVEAELLGVVAAEARRALERGVVVVEVDTSSGSPSEHAVDVLAFLRRSESRCCIDWLSLLSEEELAEVFRIVEAGE